MEKQPTGAERRQFVRIKKHFIIRFTRKTNPSMKYEVSQVENISKGGMSFTSAFAFDIGEILSIELRTPYITETVYLEGTILESKDRIPGIVFINRLKFANVTPQASDILDKVEKYNSKGE